MSKGFLFIGALIFAFYLYFLFYNIIYKTHKRQKKNHYPELSKEDIFEEYREANDDDESSY
ncbi:hypothetical protein [uncultured Winogradskyella sp.]|jgi:hypothetical protein|uniref:hypothetical protein n=1 Tax=uncultured Winogradskyella sp. TaxID=395353 RepID=UPI003513AB41